jgi:mannosyltransferase
MRGWIHGGLSEAWLRLPSALAGIASVPMLYIVGRRLLPAGAAVAAAALLAFSPTHVYYSHEARSYTLTIFLVLLSSYFFIRAVEQGRRADWVLWTTVSILAFYSHYFAALVLVAQVGSLLFLKTPAATWKRVLFGTLLILLAASPGLTYVFRAAPENLNFTWMPRATPKEIWSLARFFGGNGIKVCLAFVLWIAGVVAIARARQRDAEEFWHGMLIVSWALLPAVIAGLVSMIHPIFMARYLIFSLPAMALLAAAGMTVLTKMHAGPVLVVALCAMSIPTIFKDYHKPREDWRDASSAILTSAQSGDAVVFFPFYTRIMLDYYHDRGLQDSPPVHVFAPGFYDGGEDERNLLQALAADPGQFRHVWVVLYGVSPKIVNLEQASPALAARLWSTLGEPQVRRFTDIDVLEFGK